MHIPGLNFLFILQTSLLALKDFSACFAASDVCQDLCSNVYDPVCGTARSRHGSAVVKKFHNICHFNKIQCRLKLIDSTFDLEKLPDFICGIELKPTRRIHDFSIVGAHQACNHTCPTFCLDTYDPACAQIWAPNMQSYEYRPMINHCHIDLYSCVLGVNVTIQPLIGKCYKNPSALNFMFNVASLKTLKLLSEPGSNGRTRRNSINNIEMQEFDDLLQMLL